MLPRTSLPWVKELASIPNINITNNFGNTIVCDNSQLNFNLQPPKTTVEEVKTKIQNKEGITVDPKRLLFDGIQFDSGQSTMKYGLAITHNRSEFCHGQTSEGEATFKAYTATEHQPTHINKDNSSIINTTATALSNQLTNRNINITNNFGIIIVCHDSQLNFNVQPNNIVKEVKLTKIQNKEGITADPKQLIFDGKQLDGGQSNMKYDLANIHNRSEFCLGQVVATSTSEGEATFKAHTATVHQPIDIKVKDNSGIMIITVCSKCNSNVSEASNVMALSEEVANILKINITNNFGNTIVCDNSQLNIDVQPNDTIEIIPIQDKKGVSLDQQRLIIDGKHFDDRQLNMKSSLLTNRSEFCQSFTTVATQTLI